MILIAKSLEDDRILGFLMDVEGKMGLFRKISAMVLGGALCLAAAGAVCAGTASIIGNWRTIDHKTNRPSSIIRVWQHDGKFFGKVVKIYLENGHKTTDHCVRCTGPLRNKRVLGLTIIADMVFDKGMYGGGKILDPTTGRRYHCRMKVTADGRRLKLRGYFGIPLLGRTDIWFRAPNR